MKKKAMIRVRDFSKSYGNFEAVKNISFDVYEGEIFGFVGPNGAGKSTTINTLCTILPKTSGEVLINGNDVSLAQDRVRRDIGVVFQDMTLDGKMTVEQTLRLHCDFYNIPKKEVNDRIDFVLELVDLSDCKKAMIPGLSGGMKRRVEIARGMLHHPKVLFLDEPTTGLDPKSRENIWKYIRELQEKEGTTVFLTTHYMEEAEVCRRMAVMQNGKITAIDTPANLKQRYTRAILDISCIDETGAKSCLDRGKIVYYPFGDKLRVEVEDSEQAMDVLYHLKGKIHDFEFRHGTLNDVFLNVIERSV